MSEKYRSQKNAEKVKKVVLIGSAYIGIVLLAVLLARIFLQGLPF